MKERSSGNNTSNLTDTNHCPHCFNKRNQFARHLHFLQLGDEVSIAGHLREQYGDRAETDGTISAILGWVSSIRQSYQGKVDTFGRPLPVWEAWALSHGATSAWIAHTRQRMQRAA